MDTGVEPFKADHGGIDRVAEFLFLWVEIANGVAFFDGAACADGAGRGEQCFGKRGLACCAMADKGYGTKVGELSHAISQ